jgi:polyisoprenoid-binding protein YceI
MLLRDSFAVALALLTPLCSSHAAPIRQVLVRPSSSITFGVRAPNPTLTMNGSFREFGGSVSLDPYSITRSRIELSLALSSAQLPPDQILQAVFIQTALSRFPQKSSTFQSTEIEHLENDTYLIHGTYSWMNKRKPASVPVEITKATPSLTEIRLLLDGSFTNKGVPSEFSNLADSAQGARGWSKAVLVFSPSGRS